jgi:hypothetical protein
MLVFGPYSDPFFKAVINSFKQNPNSDFEELTPKQLAIRYPNVSMGPEVAGVLDPEAGVLMADKALKVVWVGVVKVHVVKRWFAATQGFTLHSAHLYTWPRVNFQGGG